MMLCFLFNSSMIFQNRLCQTFYCSIYTESHLYRSIVYDLVASSNGVADCSQLKTPHHPATNVKNIQPVFGLAVLGNCRNVAVQHGGLCERGP